MSRKIINYVIVYGIDDIQLNHAVMASIQQGWEPFGSVFHAKHVRDSDNDKTYLHQPMVQYVSAVPFSVSDYECMKEQHDASRWAE